VYTTTKQKSITTEPAVCSELDTSIPQFDIFGILVKNGQWAGCAGCGFSGQGLGITAVSVQDL
ncbi:MAG: hypothetical protein OXD38_14705, partial [Aestuariivita sp.]|nr:hypothetical protein [Aestuariivita sp.]